MSTEFDNEKLSSASQHALEDIQEQRTADLGRVFDQATELEIKRRVRAAEIAAHTKDQDQHLARINGSQKDAADDIAALRVLVQSLVVAVATISNDISNMKDNQVSNRALFFSAAGLALVLIGLFFAGGGHIK
jgi:wobble nucleotide-excising tRNase